MKNPKNNPDLVTRELKFIPIKDLECPIVFLNGDTWFDGPEKDLFQLFAQLGKDPYKINQLYYEPMKLSYLKGLKVKSIIIQTTGYNRDAFDKLVHDFKLLKFVPLNIVLIFPDNAWCAARDFKKENPQTNILSFYGDEGFEEIDFGL